SDNTHAHKKLSITDLIRFSSNVATVNLQKKMGFAKVEDTYRKIGFFEKTGIEIQGESRGIYSSPSSSQKLERATISYGHGIAVTPIQILKAYSVFANQGFRVQPKIFKSHENYNSQESMRIFSQRTIDQMQKILKAVVEEGGTGVLAKIQGYQSAGKTGTSLKARQDGKGYVAGAYQSSFAGYFPAENPEIVAYVMVDNPRINGKYASQVAAPLFAEMTEAYLSIVHGLRGDTIAKENFYRRKSQDKESWSIDSLPIMKGMNLVHALKSLEGLPVRVEVEGQGLIVDGQDIRATSKSGEPDTVRLRVR
ncbi:hypothetical protein GW915_14055, partial [bacterium]|nr:hypothetical protein [bacterium]